MPGPAVVILFSAIGALLVEGGKAFYRIEQEYREKHRAYDWTFRLLHECNRQRPDVVQFGGSTGHYPDRDYTFKYDIREGAKTTTLIFWQRGGLKRIGVSRSLKVQDRNYRLQPWDFYWADQREVQEMVEELRAKIGKEYERWADVPREPQR